MPNVLYEDQTQALWEDYQSTLAKELGRPAKPGHHLDRHGMTGEVIEVEDDIPHALDPSTEAYWSA